MQLQNKVAIVYGAGAVGGAAAKAFAADGARVFVASRSKTKASALVDEIGASGGVAEFDIVDALDEAAVERHADAAAGRAGRIDISMNAIGIAHVQGTPLASLSFEEYAEPLHGYTRTNFLTARAAARHMTKQGAGVILTLSTPGSRMAGGGFMGYAAACASIEAMTRNLAGELGPSGVRAVCLLSDAIPEALGKGSHTQATFRKMAAGAGLDVEAMLAARAGTIPLRRMPTLADLGGLAAFMASDRASAVTGAVVNMTCGFLVD
jgi:3-oxoacyl-[acyl-carrier protein] reductase